MSKPYKILTILLAVAILAVLYLIISVKPVDNLEKQIGKKPRNAEEIDLAKLELENNYKKNVEEIYSDYLSLIKSADLTVDQLERSKERLLALKMPTKFKDLHLDFIMAIIKMENYIENGAIEEKNASQKLIDKIKADYVWLN